MPKFNAPPSWTTTFLGITKSDTSKSEKCTDILTGVWNKRTELCVISINQQLVHDEVSRDEGSVGTCRMGCAQYIADYANKNGKTCYTATAKEQTWDLSDDCIGSNGAQINNFVYMCMGTGSMCPNSNCGGKTGEVCEAARQPSGEKACIWRDNTCLSNLADAPQCFASCAANLSGFTSQPSVQAMVQQPGGACDQACAVVKPYKDHPAQAIRAARQKRIASLERFLRAMRLRINSLQESQEQVNASW